VGKKSHKRPVDIRVLKIEDGRDGQEVVSMAQGYGLMHGFVIGTRRVVSSQDWNEYSLSVVPMIV
jgi:hypothetical protein